jgi:7-cyano-7-deazaguanine reductase
MTERRDAPVSLSEAAKEAAREAAATHRLELADNPNPRIDYLVRLEGTLWREDRQGETAITLHYVPDRLLLRAAAFDDYLKHLTTVEAGPSLPERLALRVLGDVNDELVPRWLQVVVGAGPHRVLVEDRQPKWDNRALLDRVSGL